MDRIVDITGAQIARRIKLERDARGWSQAELAERADVAKATISKIERGDMSPTAAMLVRLASAFDLTLAGLLLRAEGEKERLTRRGDQAVWRDPETGYLRRQIFSRASHPLEIAEIEMPAGQKVALPASSFIRIRQVVLVRTGSLTIEEQGTRHALAAGDCLEFGPPSDVILANETADSCTYLVILARS